MIRRHFKTISQNVKNVNILEVDDDIKIHHEKRIDKSTNMASIGLEMSEVAFDLFLESWKPVAWHTDRRVLLVLT